MGAEREVQWSLSAIAMGFQICAMHDMHASDVHLSPLRRY